MFFSLKKISESFNEWKYKKVFGMLGFVLFLLLVPNISHAGLIDITYGFLSKIAFGISYLIALVGGMIVAVLIVALQMIITVSTGIVNSTPVQIGFPIVLSVANLGFVLAVIVIAIATILRQEGYGIKKLLANVVIMAVLVNFGLVISGAILGFSNKVTNYFLDSMTGGTMDFASIMAGTMNPQKAFFNSATPPVSETRTDENRSTSTVANPGDAAILSKLGDASQNGAGFGSLLMPLVSVLLTILNIIIMIVTLFALLAAFVVRYIKLSIYLIVLPIAWMGSVFPGNGWFGKWRKGFIEQVFYPPVVIFFLWLSMRVSAGMSGSDGLKFEAVAVGGNSITSFLGNLVAVPLQGLMQAVVLAGIMLSGDYVGKMLGVEGAGAATKVSTSTKKWAQGKVTRAGARAGGMLGAKSLNATRAGVSKAGTFLAGTGFGAGAMKIGSNLQKFGAGSSSKLVRGITAPIRGVASLPGKAGTEVSAMAARGEKATSEMAGKSYRDEVAKYGEEELLIRAEKAKGLERAAMLERAAKDPKLMAKMMDLPGFREGMKDVAAEKDLYTRYGFKNGHEEAMLQSGEALAAVQPLDAALKAEQAKTAPDPVVVADLKAKMDKLGFSGVEAVITKMSKESIASIVNGKSTFGLSAGDPKLEAIQKSTVESLMKGNSSKITGVLQALEEKNEADKFTSMLHSSGIDAGQISQSVKTGFSKGTLGSLFDEDELLAPALYITNTPVPAGSPPGTKPARIKMTDIEIKNKLYEKAGKPIPGAAGHVAIAEIDAKAAKIDAFIKSLP